MKARYCFDCGKPLEWREFTFQNFNLSHAYLRKLWNHDAIQLYCCECFKDEMALDRGMVHFLREVKKKKEAFQGNDVDLLKE